MKIFQHRRALFFAGMLVLVPPIVMVQETWEKNKDTRAVQQKVEAPLVDSGVRYHSGNRVDPFLNPVLLKKKAENPDEEVPRGQPPPGIAGMYIAQVKLLGIVTGEGPPKAIFLGTDQRAYFLQETDKLFDGFMRKIEADSVLMIRETKLRSGKTVTQEVTKRLRTP